MIRKAALIAALAVAGIPAGALAAKPAHPTTPASTHASTTAKDLGDQAADGALRAPRHAQQLRRCERPHERRGEDQIRRAQRAAGDLTPMPPSRLAQGLCSSAMGGWLGIALTTRLRPPLTRKTTGDRRRT